MALDDSNFPLYESVSGTLHIGTTGTIDPAIRLSDTNNQSTIFNSGRLNTDFRVLPTGTNTSWGLFFDASTSRLGINTTSPESALHIKDFCLEGGLKIESSADCSEGAFLHVVHKPSTGSSIGESPAVINLVGSDESMEEVIYGQIRTTILDNRSSVGDTKYTSGELSFYVDNTGTLSPVFLSSIQKTQVGLDNTTTASLYETIVGALNFVNSGNSCVIIGNNNAGNDIVSGVIIGSNNSCSGLGFMGLTNHTIASGLHNLVNGDIILLLGSENINFGSNSHIVGDANSIIGHYTSVTGSSGLVLGNLNHISGNYSNVIGLSNIVNGEYNLVYGSDNEVQDSNHIISFGNSQSLSGVSGAILLGSDITGTGLTNSIVIGLVNTYPALPDSLLFGNHNDLVNYSENLILYGQNNFINGGDQSVIIGESNHISGSMYNLCIGQKNSTASDDSNNNIIFGSLTNQTGAFVYTTGYDNGFSAHIDGNINHNILAGINNISLSSDNTHIVGHKNFASGDNNIAIGSFNLIMRNDNTFVGNSNVGAGTGNVVLGRVNRSFGDNTVNIGSNNYAVGNNALNIGSNQNIVSGHVVGHSNVITNVNNLVYGANNTIGNFPVYPFKYNQDDSTIRIHYDAEEFLEGDTALIYIINQNNVVKAQKFVIENRDYSSTETGFTTLGGFSASSSTIFYCASSFDDDTAATEISGYITKANDSTGLEYGKHNIVLGYDNLIAYNTGIYIGSNNSVSGNNIVAIGNNIDVPNSNNNLVVIQSVLENRFVSDTGAFHINPNRAQQATIIYGQSEGLQDTATFDMANNRLGINKNIPEYTLDVDGIIAGQSLILSEGAVEGYVLTSDASGSGSWTQAVTTDGQVSALPVLLENSMLSGSPSLLYVPANTGLNFFNSTILFSPTGQFFVNTPVQINDVLSVDTNQAYITNVTVNSLNVTSSSVTMSPDSFSSGVLRVDTNGNLGVKQFDQPYLLLFNDSSNYVDGSIHLKYIPESGIYLNSNFTDNENFVLSTNSSVDTIINHNLSNNLTIYSSDGAVTRKSHFSKYGVFSINSDEPLEPVDNEALRVVGKTWTNSLKVGTTNSTTSGYYLRAIDDDGNLALQPISLPFNQLAAYPLTTVAQDGFNTFKVMLTKYKKYQNTVNELQGGNREDSGAVFVYRGLNGDTEDSRWRISTNFRTRNSDHCTNCIDGVEIGERTSLLQHKGGFAYSAGCFDDLADNEFYNENNASAQYAMYHLRNATDGIQAQELISNYPSGLNAPNMQNTMSFSDSVLELGYPELVAYNNHRQYIWQYNISINAIWQSGQDQSTIDGGSFVYEGVVKCRKGYAESNTTYELEKIGQETVKSYLPVSHPSLSGIVALKSDEDGARLQVIGSGNSPDYKIKWSCIARINQINMRLDNFNF